MGTRTSKITFDLATLRENSVMRIKDDNGKTRVLRCSERFYMPSELMWMLRTLGFRKVEIFGGTVGAFSRKAKPSPKEFELLVVAEK